MNRPAAALALLLALGCRALPGGSDRPLFSLEDPRGDDHGDGDLRYPGGRELERGELDLLSFRALPARGGTLFEATFARPVRRPERRPADASGAQLEDVARLGFYTFNVDVYVDTDRVPGSGRTAMLPGRKAEVDPASAWEKAIVLTPRPSDAASLLRSAWTRAAIAERTGRGEALAAEEEERLARAVADEVSRTVFFPTQVRVAGARVSFFVPDAFLGGPGDPRFGYVVAVTGANLAERVDVLALFGKEPRPTDLFVLPIVPGFSQDRFGGGRVGDPLQPPIVDLVVPPGAKQEEVLRTRGPARPAIVPAVVPAAVPAAVPAG